MKNPYPQDLFPEELARLLFNKLVKTYPLVSKEWRERRRPLLEALIAYEHDPEIAAWMRDKYHQATGIWLTEKQAAE